MLLLLLLQGTSALLIPRSRLQRIAPTRLNALSEINFGLGEGQVGAIVTAAEAIAVSGGIYLLLQLGSYWKAQFMTASIIGGIPQGQKIVEIDAQDGKNVFYLPKNSEYCAVMKSGVGDKKTFDSAPPKDQTRMKEKARQNEQLILECIGNANRENMNLKGKLRERTQDIPAKVYTLYTLHTPYTLYTLYLYTLYTIHYTHYIHYTLYTIYTLYTLYTTLYPSLLMSSSQRMPSIDQPM